MDKTLDDSALIADWRAATIDPARADEAELELRRMLADADSGAAAAETDCPNPDAPVKRGNFEGAMEICVRRTFILLWLEQRRRAKAVHDLRQELKEEYRQEINAIKRHMVDLLAWLQKIDPKRRAAAKPPSRFVRKVRLGR